ncbi:hypothetical protein Bbelb_242930 [Branchiostoma belcheri]|nr:hypothetical protein Bbelb_242930 [Branchiostoma belcheri]
MIQIMEFMHGYVPERIPQTKSNWLMIGGLLSGASYNVRKWQCLWMEVQISEWKRDGPFKKALAAVPNVPSDDERSSAPGEGGDLGDRDNKKRGGSEKEAEACLLEAFQEMMMAQFSQPSPRKEKQRLKGWRASSVLSTLLETSYNALSTTQVLHTVQEVHGDTPCQTLQNCERGFSTMKRVKTPLRNRLKEETLNNHLMISVDCPQLRSSTSTQAVTTNQTDYFKEYSSQVSRIYRNQVLATLQNEYRRISVNDLRTILRFYKFHYAPAKKFIQENILAKLQSTQSMCENNKTSQESPQTSQVVHQQVCEKLSQCSCGRCEAMPTVDESVCCHEQMRVLKRERVPGILCITEHHGFQTVCQDEDVLETAHNGYQDQYREHLGNECKRYTAYRQFVEWCYQYLGRNVRVPLPSCAVTAIRRAFFSIHSLCIQLHFAGNMPKTRADPVEVHYELPVKGMGRAKNQRKGQK